MSGQIILGNFFIDAQFTLLLLKFFISSNLLTVVYLEGLESLGYTQYSGISARLEATPLWYS